MDGKIINIRDYNKPTELKKYAGGAHGICFAGMAASFRTEESDVILVAANLDDLRRWYAELGRDLDEKYAEHVAVFNFRDMRGKRLWK